MNKRGLSGVITTVLLVLLIFVAIGAVAFTVNKFIQKGAEGISLDSLTIDMEIVKVIPDWANDLIDVRIKRNSGEGEITAIKFVVEDAMGSYVFNKEVDGFGELAERTFTLDLTESEFLDKFTITKISIASVYKSETGESDFTGEIEDEYELGINEVEGEDDEDGTVYCDATHACPTDPSIDEDKKTCDATHSIIRAPAAYYSCFVGECVYGNEELIDYKDCKEDGNFNCQYGACVPDVVSCVLSSECGTDGPVENKKCSDSDKTLVFQDYRTYNCQDGFCSTPTDTQIMYENCSIDNPGYECYEGLCVEVPECTSDFDCEELYTPAYFCNATGKCEIESAVNSGTVGYAFPSSGEFFESANLPTDLETGNYKNYHIIFPGSPESRCLKIDEHIYPNITSSYIYAYLRLNESITSILNSNNYEIWKRNYICSTI